MPDKTRVWWRSDEGGSNPQFLWKEILDLGIPEKACPQTDTLSLGKEIKFVEEPPQMEYLKQAEFFQMIPRLPGRPFV